MKSFLYFVSLISMFSCQWKNNETNNKVIKDRSYEYIDVDPTKSTLTDEDKIRLKIVLNRLYKHVEIVDDYYIIKISKGSEINISERLFSFYKKSFETLNRDIEKLKKTNPDTLILVPPQLIK